MANCVACGDELHPERAEKYDYCTKPECRERNNKGVEMVAVGVNKAADQFVILNERTRLEMASGRYRRRPDALESPRRPSWIQRPHGATAAPLLVPRSSRRGVRPHWSEAQKNLVLIYRAMGMNPEEIAKKIGVSRYLVTQILLTYT